VNHVDPALEPVAAQVAQSAAAEVVLALRDADQRDAARFE
jgi:hypothetical protein